MLRRLTEGDVEKQILLFFCRQILAGSGAIAQLGERLPCTQEVSGSIPLGSTTSALRSHGSELRNEHSVRMLISDFCQIVL